MNQSEQG